MSFKNEQQKRKEENCNENEYNNRNDWTGLSMYIDSEKCTKMTKMLSLNSICSCTQVYIS